MSTHESFDRGTGVRSASDRSFGLVMAAFFALVGALPLLRDPPSVRWWAVGIAAIFLLLALWWQALLATPNRVWLKVALLLHRIVSPVILAVMFYGTVVPIGLIMRAIGKNPLRMQRDPAAASYWIAREPGTHKHDGYSWPFATDASALTLRQLSGRNGLSIRAGCL